jgi:hypothetical protein
VHRIISGSKIKNKTLVPPPRAAQLLPRRPKTLWSRRLTKGGEVLHAAVLCFAQRRQSTAYMAAACEMSNSLDELRAEAALVLKSLPSARTQQA